MVDGSLGPYWGKSACAHESGFLNYALVPGEESVESSGLPRKDSNQY